MSFCASRGLPSQLVAVPFASAGAVCCAHVTIAARLTPRRDEPCQPIRLFIETAFKSM